MQAAFIFLFYDMANSAVDRGLLCRHLFFYVIPESIGMLIFPLISSKIAVGFSVRFNGKKSFVIAFATYPGAGSFIAGISWPTSVVC